MTLENELLKIQVPFSTSVNGTWQWYHTFVVKSAKGSQENEMERKGNKMLLRERVRKRESEPAHEI